MNRTGRVLLFDFDGTVSLGEGPVIRYAQCVAATLSQAERSKFLEAVADQNEAGAEPNGSVTSAPVPRDGYDSVRLAASVFSIPADTLGQAYRRSRADLASAKAPIEPVPGLAHFLAETRERAFLVLATNSPNTRIPEALHALGLDDAFDDVITSVGKPRGLDSVLDGLQRASTAGPLRLLSIGDVWANDLEPAFRRGFQTALIGASTPSGAAPTHRALRLDELFPVITAWLEAPAGPRVDGSFFSATGTR